MRYVVDGTLGGGKTVFLTGTSPADEEGHEPYTSVRSLGYRVFSELIRGTVDARLRVTSDPFDDWDAFFSLAIDRAEQQFRDGEGEEVSFYDRGLPFLSVMARRYGYAMPERYGESLRRHRYDSPVLIFDPIESTDYTAPRRGEVRASTFTLAERLAQHRETVEAYESLGYEILRVPVFEGSKETSIRMRYEYVRSQLGL